MWHIKPEAPKKGATRLWSQFDWLAAGLWAFDFLFDFNVTWCTPAQKHFFFERHNPLLYHAWSMGRRCARHAEDPGNSTNRKSNITGFMCNWAAYWNKRGPVPLHRVLIPGPSQATGAGWREFFLWTDKRMLRISLLIKHVSNIFLNSALFTSIFTGEQSSSSSSSFLVLCYVSPGMSSPSVEQHETGKYVDHAVRRYKHNGGPTHQSVALLAVWNRTFTIGRVSWRRSVDAGVVISESRLRQLHPSPIHSCRWIYSNLSPFSWL